MKKKPLKPKQKDWNEKTKGAASRAGQLIGGTFENLVYDFVTSYLEEHYPDYRLFEPDEGEELIKLDMLGGSSKQLDSVIGLKNSTDPVALLESKWLKDGRHHNDKGAWILQLREVKKQSPTVRGAAAIVAGYWTEGVMIMLANEGGIDTVLVATDEEVYQTLQPHLNEYLGENSFTLEAREMRDSYPNPGDLANCLEHLNTSNKLSQIAQKWLDFSHTDNHQVASTGRERIAQAIDNLLQPLPDNVTIEQFEISLQVSSGNIIHQTFDDMESAMAFMENYFRNSKNILKVITPKPDETPRQMRLDDSPDSD